MLDDRFFSFYIFYSVIFVILRCGNVDRWTIFNFINGLILAIERYYRENRDPRNWPLNGKRDEASQSNIYWRAFSKASSAKCSSAQFGFGEKSGL